MNQKPLLIVPAYNEQDSIERVINNIITNFPELDYVVINDGSKDATLQILEKNSFNYLNLSVNVGLHGAIQAGLKYASERGYQCAIQYDGDGQHKAEYVKYLAEAVLSQSCDIAIGSRFVDVARPATMRMIGSRLITFAIKLVTGKTIKDPTSGMRAYNTKIISLFANSINYGPEPDTIAYMLMQKYRIKEIQVEMDERLAGVSYLGVSASIKYMLRMLVSIIFIQPFRKK